MNRIPGIQPTSVMCMYNNNNNPSQDVSELKTVFNLSADDDVFFKFALTVYR